MATLRLALAQLNVTVGDLDGNRRLIEEAIRRAQAWMADLVVVPELALPGYPPEDLLLKPQFVEANLQALQRLTSAAQGLVALVGYVDRDPQGRLYSAAAVLTDGRRVATYRKQCLPNYGVFDEQRYFTPGSQPLVVEVRGVRVGVTICEDLWEEAPCRAVAASGASSGTTSITTSSDLTCAPPGRVASRSSSRVPRFNGLSGRITHSPRSSARALPISVPPSRSKKKVGCERILISLTDWLHLRRVVSDR